MTPLNLQDPITKLIHSTRSGRAAIIYLIT